MSPILIKALSREHHIAPCMYLLSITIHALDLPAFMAFQKYLGKLAIYLWRICNNLSQQQSFLRPKLCWRDF
jgi:hypothetical protein